MTVKEMASRIISIRRMGNAEIMACSIDKWSLYAEAPEENK